MTSEDSHDSQGSQDPEAHPPRLPKIAPPPIAPSEIEKRQGAFLPHWTGDKAIISSTMRLADSLPKGVAEKYREERERLRSDENLTAADLRAIHRLFAERIDSALDKAHGACHLRDDRVAKIVADALAHFDGERYRLGPWCVMPNHVHVVFQLVPGHGLDQIMHSWKSFTAKEANHLIGRTGVFWQNESYDHLVRDVEDLGHHVRYVRNNPAKAGLKAWKWQGCGSLDVRTWLERPAQD